MSIFTLIGYESCSSNNDDLVTTRVRQFSHPRHPNPQ
jgi:hypothetical protein